MGEVRKSLPALYKKYGITAREPGPPKPKKKKSWWRSALDNFLARFRAKPKPEEITRPAGVTTPEQIKEWKEIMRMTEGRKK